MKYKIGFLPFQNNSGLNSLGFYSYAAADSLATAFENYKTVKIFRRQKVLKKVGIKTDALLVHPAALISKLDKNEINILIWGTYSKASGEKIKVNYKVFSVKYKSLVFGISVKLKDNLKFFAQSDYIAKAIYKKIVANKLLNKKEKKFIPYIKNTDKIIKIVKSFPYKNSKIFYMKKNKILSKHYSENLEQKTGWATYYYKNKIWKVEKYSNNEAGKERIPKSVIIFKGNRKTVFLYKFGTKHNNYILTYKNGKYLGIKKIPNDDEFRAGIKQLKP